MTRGITIIAPFPRPNPFPMGCRYPFPFFLYQMTQVEPSPMPWRYARHRCWYENYCRGIYAFELEQTNTHLGSFLMPVLVSG